MSRRIDSFYPILPDAAWIARLVPLGIRTVQLRVKGLSGPALSREIRRSQEICTANDCLLIVNDHWREAINEGCQAVHLGQEDMADADWQALRAAGLSIGISTHDEHELDKALAVNPDYIALGPVYGTLSKEVPWPTQGLDKVREWRERVTDHHLVAIGGITLESSADLYRAGADSLAVIADVTTHDDPVQRVRNWLAQTAAMRG